MGEVTDKDAAFQYYDGATCIEDTGLITLEEARSLWSKYNKDFKKKAIRALEYDRDTVEMCIWCNMDSNINYQDIDKTITTHDLEVVDGELFYARKPFTE